MEEEKGIYRVCLVCRARKKEERWQGGGADSWQLGDVLEDLRGDKKELWVFGRVFDGGWAMAENGDKVVIHHLFGSLGGASVCDWYKKGARVLG